AGARLVDVAVAVVVDSVRRRQRARVAAVGRLEWKDEGIAVVAVDARRVDAPAVGGAAHREAVFVEVVALVDELIAVVIFAVAHLAGIGANGAIVVVAVDALVRAVEIAIDRHAAAAADRVVDDAVAVLVDAVAAHLRGG